jgi:hypothetical protein
MNVNHIRKAVACISAVAIITVLLGLGWSDVPQQTTRDRVSATGAVDNQSVWALLEAHGTLLPVQPNHDWISRSRTAMIDLVGFRAFMHDPGGQPRIMLPLFEDVIFFARTHRIDQPHDDRWTWVGEIEDIEGGHVIVSVREGVAYGMVNAPGWGLFEFHPMPLDGPDDGDPEEVYVVHQIDADALPGCGVGPEHCVDPVADQPRRGIVGFANPDGGGRGHGGDDDDTASDTTYTLRVMVAYTASTQNAVGGQDAMHAFIDSTIAQTNLAFANSMINIHAELAHAHLVDYSEAGNIGTDLQRITGVDNGYMDEVHWLRALHQADLVALLVTYGGGACGVAWCMNDPSVSFAPLGFSVTRIQCVSNLTFPHELGHNMGCHHDHQNSGGSCGSYAYSYGHRFFGNSGSQWRTVLAYTPGQRITHFSNPNVNYDGQPTGVPVGDSGQAHNAQTINLNAPIVTSFAEQFEPPLPPENNECESRIVVSDGVTSFTSEFATTDGPEEPLLCTYFDHSTIANDVWYEYTATCSGELTVGLCSSSFATKLGIYEGAECPEQPDTVLVCDAFSCDQNMLSKITMMVQKGETFIIRAGGRVDHSGEGVLAISCEQVLIPGDLDGNGVVDGSDLLLLLEGWGECSDCDDCPADLNDDCSVDGNDLLILLSNWG